MRIELEQLGRELGQVMPVIEGVGGSQPYLWIGNGGSPEHCYAVLTKPDDLERLRDHLTEMLRAHRRVPAS